MIFVRCKFCGQRTQIRKKHYERNLELHNVMTLAELDNCYICRKCRKLFSSQLFRYEGNPKFRKAQKEISEAYAEFVRRGINDIAAKHNFIASVKKILDPEHVFSYTWHQKADNPLILEGLLLRDLPFYGNVFMKIIPIRK